MRAIVFIVYLLDFFKFKSVFRKVFTVDYEKGILVKNIFNF
jgi:hypothetical protein